MASGIPGRPHLTEADKVIFLDVDGVLHNAYEGKVIFDPKCMNLLKELVEKTRAKIVLSSSWRELPKTRHLVDEKLREYGMEIFDQTHISLTNYREEEISDWLHFYAPQSKFVILDDWDMSRTFPDNMVCTCGPDRSGLIESDIEKALKILE